jgi:hypothetical protein
MPNVVDLSCGNYKCVYGNKEDEEVTYGVCKCIPYPRFELTHFEKDNRTEKVKSAKWAIHLLRAQNKKLHEEVAHLTDRLYAQK